LEADKRGQLAGIQRSSIVPLIAPDLRLCLGISAREKIEVADLLLGRGRRIEQMVIITALYFHQHIAPVDIRFHTRL
jgi:hypothetical protein